MGLALDTTNIYVWNSGSFTSGGALNDGDGTVVQIALAGGATSFTALATSLFTTASGGTAAALIAILTFNLEAGIRRAQR